MKYCNPALSNASGTDPWSSGNAFTGVLFNYYWSSTTFVCNAAYAYCMLLGSGEVVSIEKDYYEHVVWPVRGGQ